MGDIADMMIDGDMCQICGMFLGEGDGYPRTCASCKSDDRKERRHNLPSHDRVSCNICGKRVKKKGLAMHQKDVHFIEESAT